MRYIKERNQGIIALIKKNGKYEFNALDSSYCVLEDYAKEIENGEFFNWIRETQLDYELMQKDFAEVRNSNNKELLEKYLIWEKPNIYIDFDNKILINNYFDRAFEKMTLPNWTSEYEEAFDVFEKNIPKGLKYWK